MTFNKRRQTHFALGETCVVYIRKNACSALKAMILDDIGETNERKTDTQKMADYRLCTYENSTTAKICCFIIRDPLHRIVSGWLNQVVQKVDLTYPEMFDAITDATSKHPRDVTFRDFLNSYLISGKINGHFKPVVDHLYPILYTHVLHDKSLYEDARITFGDERAQKFFFRPLNATQLLKSETVKNACNITAGELFDSYKKHAILPSKESFLNINNAKKIQGFYAEDVSIYQSYLKKRNNTSNPVSMDFTGK